MSAAVEPVIAGSRGFALALLAPLTERIGTRPRLAPDAAQAAPLCSGPHGLVVVEFLGSDTFREIQDLVAEASGVRVVAAVPAKHAAADAPLRALGVEVARWDGTSSAILGAVGRQLAVCAAVQPSRALRPVPPPPPAPPAAAATPVPIARQLPREPPRAAAPRTPPARTPPPAPPPTWPGGIPNPSEAARVLRVALAGGAPAPGPIAACAAGVAAGLSDLERSALGAEPQGFDLEPVREAAVMRVRVAAALATAPRRNERVDGAAVSALLGDFDALLSRVNALAGGAPEGARASIESIRDDLVRQAIRFSQRANLAEPGPASPAAPAPIPHPRAHVVAPKPRAAARSRRGLALWIALGIAAVLAGGYHGFRWRERRAVRAARSAGAPAGMLELAGGAGPRFLVPATAHEKPDPAEIARLRAAEEARGNAVLEADGILLVVPAPMRAPAPPPAAPAPAPALPPQELE